MNEIRWGMIGCGNVTERKSGAPAINKVPHSKLVAVMTRKMEKAADYAQRHQVDEWYDNADELIANPLVNAIYIATPPDVHLKYAEKSMRAGKPTYVEKPMARDYSECEAMNRISRETGAPLFVAYYRRALPYFIKIKELIEDQAIGVIRCVILTLHWPPYPEEIEMQPQPRWRVFPQISGGGHFHDLASHQFDFLEYTLGPIKVASGISRNQAGLYPADDLVVANFEFESGVLGTGNWCFTVNAAQRLDRSEIIGTAGKISFSFFGSSIITVETPDGMVEYDIPQPPHVQQPLIQSIVQELRGEGKCPSSGKTAARANLILDWITGKAGK